MLKKGKVSKRVRRQVGGWNPALTLTSTHDVQASKQAMRTGGGLPRWNTPCSTRHTTSRSEATAACSRLSPLSQALCFCSLTCKAREWCKHKSTGKYNVLLMHAPAVLISLG